MIDVFFNTIFGEDNQDNKLIWTLKDKKSHWFTDIGKMIEFVENNPEDIYYGLGTTGKKKGPYERVTIEEVSTINMINLDIDIKSDVAHKKQNLPATMEEAIAIAKKFLTPTYLIDSGHGLHALFAVTDIDLVKNKNLTISLFQQFQEAHRAAFPHYDIDYTYDLARVLRCPGSINCKDPNSKVPCTILEHNPEATYWVSEIQDAIDFNPVASTAGTATVASGTGTGKSKYPSAASSVDTKGWSTRDFVNWFDEQGLVLNPHASIDGDLWMDLTSADPYFTKAYNHEYEDKDEEGNVVKSKRDMNSYDMSLANIGARYGLPDQKIVDLLVMHRNKYQVNMDKLKRKDYFARTLIQSGLYKKINVITKKKAINQPITPTDQDAVRLYLEKVLKCGIQKVFRFGKDPNPQFELELTDLPGKTIKLGSFAEGIVNQKNFRAKIGAVGVTMPAAQTVFKWESDIIPKLQMITIDGTVPVTSTYEGQIQVWLTEYLVEKTVLESIDLYLKEMQIEQPFMNGDRVHFKLEALQNWIRNTKNHITDFSFITTMIFCGFTQTTIKTKDNIRIQLWMAPVGFYEQ